MNIDTCSTSKDVFDTDINLLVPDAEKQHHSGKDNSAPNDLRIFAEIKKAKMSEEELSSLLAEVAMKHWFDEKKNPVVVNKILEGLKISANCSGVPAPILNEAVAKNSKILPFNKRVDKRLSDIQKRLVFSTWAVLVIANELIPAHNQNRPFNLWKMIGHTAKTSFFTVLQSHVKI